MLDRPLHHLPPNGHAHRHPPPTPQTQVTKLPKLLLSAILGGFEALAKAFLHTAASTFAFICAATVWLSPIFVRFPLFNYERESRVIGSSATQASDDRTAPEYEGWARGIIEWHRIAESLPNNCRK
jgi:hypothetical protein